MKSSFHKLIYTASVGMVMTIAVDQAHANLADAAMNQDIAALKSLIADGANPDSRGQFETPALHWLVRYDNLDAVRLLLEKDADPNITSRYGVTPLGLAITNGNAPMVQLLLANGADANTREHNGQTVLQTAADTGVLESVRLLVEHGARVDDRDEAFGQTALMFATRAGHPHIARFLLEQGADPNASTDVGETPRWIKPNSARGFGFGIGIIRGGTPADRGRREPIPGGMTPLLYAARHDQVEIADMLLEAGADIHKAEANNINPLLMAVETNSMATAHFLIEQGSDVNVQDWYGRSPLWEAINVRNLYLHNDNFSNYITNREEIFGLIATLVDKGADLNARTKESPPIRHDLLSITGTLEWVDFTGQTPFIRAARAGDMNVMNLLLENGADPFIETFEGTNALMAAAGINWVVSQTWTESPEQLLAAVKLCIELGMDVNKPNSMGLTAIHGAANRGSNDIIELLVTHGARLDVQDNEGRTPLDWAGGVFLATHPAEEKPESMALLTRLLEEHGMPVR
jgi:ankyrin repeat protein